MTPPDTAEELLVAFPAAERLSARSALEGLGVESVSGEIEVYFRGEALVVPNRVTVPHPVSTDSPHAQAVLTRHPDGFVREQNLQLLLEHAPHWAPAFVVPMLGDYVIEIHQVILQAFLSLAEPSEVQARYGGFVTENPALLELVTQQATSYWNANHRSQFPRSQDPTGAALNSDYPAFRALAWLQTAAESA